MAIVALLLSLALHAQTGEGPALLATFKAWQQSAAPNASWAESLDRYRRVLIAGGRSPADADRAIRLITAYDEAELYDSIYGQAPAFNTAPNALLVDAIRDVTPGRALDVGMGMGRNALHLARRGWRVTGFDVSAEGVRQAHAAARAEGLALTAVVAADEEFDFGVAQWDLIALIYAVEKRSVHRIRDALRPGGLVVVEAGINADPAAAFGYRPAELPAIFAGFEIVTHDEAEALYDWGPERIRRVRFVARKPAP